MNKEARKILYYIFFTNALSPSYPAFVYGVSYPLSPPPSQPHHNGSNQPWNSSGDPQVVAHRQNFPVCLSEWRRDIFFLLYSSFFQYLSLLAVDGESAGRAEYGRTGRENKLKETEIMDKRREMWELFWYEIV